MSEAILDAMVELQAAGLTVRQLHDSSLWITATKKSSQSDVSLAKNASALSWRNGMWVAVFPAPGILSYEVPGELQKLVDLIRQVYSLHRRVGGSFSCAFEQTVPNAETFLVGRFLGEKVSASDMPPSRRIEVGGDDGLRLRVEWPSLPTTSTGSASLQTKILLWIESKLIWGRKEKGNLFPVERSCVDFLRFLSEAWIYLKWEERFPFDLQPREPSQLWNEAKARLADQDDERASEEENVIVEFDQRHDLAQAFLHGDPLKSVRVMRQGNLMWLDSAPTIVLRPVAEVLEQLTVIGDAIAGRAASSGEPSALEAADHWNRREHASHLELARIATGLSAETIGWVATATPSENWDSQTPASEFQLTEVLAAARMMVGSLKPEAVKVAISAIASLPKGSIQKLESLSDEAAGILFHRQPDRAYSEGYYLAGWLRSKWQIHYTERVDPEDFLERLAVQLTEIDIEDERLDALACWGPKHGPVVMLNKKGKHSQTPPGRRATVAHEICHLLIDREGALPLIEVLTTAATSRVEVRARAFAAELLLPRRRAEEVSRAATDIDTAVDKLRDEYGVSREIAIRQIVNSNARKSLSLQNAAQLERLVSSLERL